jgi:glycosyltransferase involved in cell wall biosynthesis
MKERRRAIVVGFDYHARYLSRLLGEYSTTWKLTPFPRTRAGLLRALWALRRADACISFGGPEPSTPLAEAARMRRIPVIVVWAGTDVLNAAANPFDMAVIKRGGYDNLAVAPWLVDELRTIGVEAAYVRVGVASVSDPIAPLPSEFRVLTYLPEPRRRFYGEERVYAIARALPDVPFVVLGPGKRSPEAPSNVAFEGNVNDVSDRIDASTVLLRLPEHDGTSLLVLEALARARHVIWTHAFPGVRYAADTEHALLALREMCQAHRDGRLAPNEQGRNYVAAEFSPSGVAARFEAHLDQVIHAHSGTHNIRRRRVAISGLGLFCAEVAKQVERIHPEWETRVLRTASRIELCNALVDLTRSQLWYSIGSPLTDRWVHLCARLMRKPRVIHWVGSDIEYLKNTPALRKHLQARAIKHLTEVSWTADELRDLGLRSEIAPLPLRHYSVGVRPLPPRFTIMLYLPKSRAEFYGKSVYESLLEELAAEAPRVLIVGGGDLKVPDTIEAVNLSWRDDLRDVYEQATVLIRLTPHDGLSLMVLEALSFGRYVMWSKPFPHALHIRCQRDLVAGLRSLLGRHQRGELFAQYAAAELVAREYSTERAVDRILRTWESVR